MFSERMGQHESPALNADIFVMDHSSAGIHRSGPVYMMKHKVSGVQTVCKDIILNAAVTFFNIAFSILSLLSLV